MFFTNPLLYNIKEHFLCLSYFLAHLWEEFPSPSFRSNSSPPQADLAKSPETRKQMTEYPSSLHYGFSFRFHFFSDLWWNFALSFDFQATSFTLTDQEANLLFCFNQYLSHMVPKNTFSH